MIARSAPLTQEITRLLVHPPAAVVPQKPRVEIGDRRRQRPGPMADAALQGIAGDVVNFLMPHTESGLPAVLLQFLVASGLYLGRTGYYLAEGDRHHTNLFTAIVGGTSKGRKGTSWGQIRRLFKLVDDRFASSCITSGISSGEGIIWAVRDEIREQHPIKEKGRVVGYEEVIVDPGISDKRLLAQEPEFARVLKSVGRESNSASAVIRESWDSGALNILTKTKAAKATNAHIGIIAHITAEELNRLLTNTEAANGFANRFLWVHTERSKELPFGGTVRDEDFEAFAHRLQEIHAWAKTAGRIQFDEQAAADWRRVYSPLSAGKPGLLGAVIGRAEAQVVRLATLYALLDQDFRIRRPHLQAALAIWDYCEASAAFIFGEALGDETADSISEFLRTSGEPGATRSEISDHLGRNKSASEIGRALEALSKAGLARSERETQEHGRPVERWFARSLRTDSADEINEMYEVSPQDEGVNSFNSYISYSEKENG